MSLIPALTIERWSDFCEFQATWVYTVRSRSARDTLLGHVLKTTTTKLKMQWRIKNSAKPNLKLLPLYPYAGSRTYSNPRIHGYSQKGLWSQSSRYSVQNYMVCAPLAQVVLPVMVTGWHAPYYRPFYFTVASLLTIFLETILVELGDQMSTTRSNE